MTIAIKKLLTRICVFMVFGILSFGLDGWVRDNPHVFEIVFRFFLYFCFLIVVVADELKGNLKSSPIYTASIEDATSLGWVKLLIAVYMLVLLVITLSIAFSGEGDFDMVTRPKVLFTIITPPVLCVILGKYVIEKNENKK